MPIQITTWIDEHGRAQETVEEFPDQSTPVEPGPEPTVETITTATVDVAALDAALARADAATTTAGKVNAVIAGLKAIRAEGGA